MSTPVSARVDLVLPWPPTVNTYFRPITGKGTHRIQMILTPRAREYRLSVLACVTALEKNPETITGPIHFSAVFHPPDRRRRDLDNLLKGLLDSLAHAAVYEDDSQITRISISFGPVDPDKKGFAEVSVEEEVIR